MKVYDFDEDGNEYMTVEKAKDEGSKEEPITNLHKIRREQALVSLYGKKCFYRMPYDLLLVLDEKHALVLGYLMNQEQKYNSEGGVDLDGGWFYVKIKDMKRDMNMDERKQRRIFDKLKNMDFLDIMHKPIKNGGSPVRHVKISYKEINRRVDDVKDEIYGEQ